MMEAINALFKFHIGQEVTHRGMLSPFQRLEPGSLVAQKFYVLSRWLEECPGGVQIHYDVRVVDARWGGATGIAATAHRVREDELVEYPA